MKSGWKYFPVIFILVILIGAIGASCEDSSPTETVTLVFTCHDPAGGFVANFSQKMFDEIEQKSGGKVKFDSHYGGELAPGFNEAYQAVIQGTADIGFTTPLEIPGQFNLNSLIVFTDWDVHSARSQVWTEIYNKYPDIRAEWDKVKVMCLASASEGPLGSTVPFRTLEDIKGHKYIGAGEILSEKLAALGFVPVSVSPPDTFMAIQTGLVDGVNIGWYYWRDFRLYEVLPYVTRVPLSQYPYAWVVNKDKWNKLPSDVRKIMTDFFESGHFAKLYDEMLWAEEASVRSAAATEYKATIIELTPAERARWETAVNGVADKWAVKLEAQGFPAKKILEDIYKLESKYAVK